jgi:large subunit ribosomal protein L21
MHVYAVVEIGGEQLLVRQGETVRIPFRAGVESGTTLQADRVLLLSDEGKTQVGNPEVAGARVSLEIVGPAKDRTILVYRKKRRKGYRRRAGHRQPWTEAVVTEIAGA